MNAADVISNLKDLDPNIYISRDVVKEIERLKAQQLREQQERYEKYIQTRSRF